MREICVNSASRPGWDSLFCLLSRLIRWTVYDYKLSSAVWLLWVTFKWKLERLYSLECDKFPIDRICRRGRDGWILRSWCNLAGMVNCRGRFHPVLPHLCSAIKRQNRWQRSIHVLSADIQTDTLHFASYHNPQANRHVQLFMIEHQFKHLISYIRTMAGMFPRALQPVHQQH